MGDVLSMRKEDVMFYLVRIFICTLFVFLFAIPGSLYGGEKLSPGIRSVIDGDRYKHSFWGILVSDLKTGKPIYELNADKLFVPASTTKLFTVATALEVLGTGYRIETPVYGNGKLTQAGELKGDLILVARGDQTLDGRTTADGRIAFCNIDHHNANNFDAGLTDPDPLQGLNKLARQVARSGIKRVRGEIIIDDRLFGEYKSTFHVVNDKVTPIVVNDNLIDLVIKPTKKGAPATVVWRPETSAYTMETRVRTVSHGNAPEIQVLSQKPGTITIRGVIPEGHKPIIRVFDVKDPASFARVLFIEALERAGVKVDASPRAGNPSDRLPARSEYSKLPRVALLTPPPFSETARLILKVSHWGAEMLPLLVAIKEGKQTFGEGMQIEGVFLKSIGVDIGEVSINNGDGGDPGNNISPKVMVQLLRAMTGRPCFAAFYAALPILGVDGTLAHDVKPDSPVRGKVRAKTGTLITDDKANNRLFFISKAWAGYMTTKGNREIVFSIVMNRCSMNTLDDMWDVGSDFGKICEAIYKAQ